MKVLQILPELDGGGVERGTLEIADHLVRNGHEAVVVSNGGRLVPALEKSGARHVALAVHRKSLASFFKVRPFRQILAQERPDILHVRSRLPGWIAWLAWRKMNPQTRPHLVTTVHGFYSVNFYSAIMTRGGRIIAVSESIRDYILKNYPRVPPEIIRVIHRGVSTVEFPRDYRPPAEWLAKWTDQNPQFANKRLLLMPGRLSRWKGQEDFIALIAALKTAGEPVHGVIVGDAHPKKMAFAEELRALASKLGVSGDVTFLGHRTDLHEIMAMSDIVYSLSRDPEAFGRVSLEAMALGRTVIGCNHGGVAEQLRAHFPTGLVAVGNNAELIFTTRRLLNSHEKPLPIKPQFTREAMCRSTVEVYSECHGSNNQ